MTRLRSLISGQAGRKGGMSLTMAMLSPAMMIALGLVIDTGFWVAAENRLQVAADSAAMADMLMLANTTAQASPPGQMKNYLLSTAQFEAAAAATKLAGTIKVTDPVSYDATAFSWVQLTLTSTPISLFSSFVPGSAAPSISATSRASLPVVNSPPCVLALGPGINQTDTGAGNIGILMENGTILSATTCKVWSNVPSPTNADYSIMALNSGAINAQKLGANGNFGTSSQTTLSPAASPGPNKGTVPDPFSSFAPTISTTQCDQTATTSATQNLTVTLSPGYYCATGTNTYAYSVAGGKTVTFKPGIYYFVNTDLTLTGTGTGGYAFDPAGVTFVFVGRGASGTAKVGNLHWSAGYTISWVPSPTYKVTASGQTSAFTIHQVCNAAVSTYSPLTFSLGSFTMNDAIYLPCGELSISGSATIKAPVGGNLGLVAASIHMKNGTSGTTAFTAHGTGSSVVPVLSLQPSQ